MQKIATWVKGLFNIVAMVAHSNNHRDTESTENRIGFLSVGALCVSVTLWWFVRQIFSHHRG